MKRRDTMFDDLFSLTLQHKVKFSDTVRDQFGQSIISDVFEPMLEEISGLQQVADLYQTKAAELDKQTTELQSIGSKTHE